MPWVGFEPTVPVSERTNTVHSLDRAATVTGSFCEVGTKFLNIIQIMLQSVIQIMQL
jgi:hypothetical protein